MYIFLYQEAWICQGGAEIIFKASRDTWIEVLRVITVVSQFNKIIALSIAAFALNAQFISPHLTHNQGYSKRSGFCQNTFLCANHFWNFLNGLTSSF